jgi:hypothetical protein
MSPEGGEEKRSMFSRATYVITLALLVPSTAWAQEAAKVCSDGTTIKIASEWDNLGLTLPAAQVAGQPLRYSISSLGSVRSAWIEVWDRPKRLSRQPVSVKLEGAAPCANCLDAEETPYELDISIFDAAEPVICIDYCAPGTPTSGAYLSEVIAGKQPIEDSDESVEPAYLLDDPQLSGDPIRMVEGSGSTQVVLSGENLIESSRVYVVSGENASAGDTASWTYLYSRTLDLRHVEVTIPSDMIKKPKILTAYARDSWPGRSGETASGPGQTIIVVSKNSPVIDSVEPRVLDNPGLDARVILRGSGFTEDSAVKFGDDLSWGAEETFVSSSELRIRIPASELKDSGGRYARPTPLKLSVVNDPSHFSDFVFIPVLPSAKFKRGPLTPTIRSIMPYPIPMMDFQSPSFLTLEIHGDNFRPDDVVAFNNGQSDRVRLKTQYVSPHHLRAWLPRESWRKHRVSFRLIVQTSAGFCAAEAFAESLE